MNKKYFLSIFFFILTVFLYAQESRSFSGKDIAAWKKIIDDERNFENDTLTLKQHLLPLKNSNSDADKVLYYGLLANSYATVLDEINTKSNSYHSNAIYYAKKSKSNSLGIWATLNYADYIYNFRRMTFALPLFMDVAEKMEQSNPKNLLFPGESFTKIGFYMGTIGDNDEAIRYLKKAQQYAKPNSSDYAKILDNMGMYYLKTGDLENARFNILNASRISKAIKDDVRYAKTLGNLAQIDELNGKYEESINLLKKDIAISEQYKSNQNTMYAYTVLGRVYIANNQIEKAKEAIQKADAIAKTKSYFKINELDILKLNLKILNKEHKEKEELSVRRRVDALEDSLNKTDGVLPLNQANWMFQKRKYQQNIEKNKKELASVSFWRNFIFGIAGLLILSVLFIIYYSRKQEKARKKMSATKIAEFEQAKINYENKLAKTMATLDAQVEFLKEKNIQIQKLHLEVENIKKSKSSYAEEDRGKLDEILQSHLMTDENWRNFRREFQKEFPAFYEILQKDFPEITDSNLRIILLQKLGFTNPEISGLLGITIDAVKKSKQRLKAKLGDRYEQLFKMIAHEY